MAESQHLAYIAQPGGPWQRVADAAGLRAPDGRLAATVFTEMTELARRTGAINLGQGFPDAPGPSAVLETAQAAIASGINQYPPGPGEPDLRAAVAEHQRRFYGVDVDPATEVLVTTGATEAIAATLLALVSPGDEVVTLDPSYDAYTAIIGLTGAKHVRVPLTPPDFQLDLDRFAKAITDRTRVILINTPHNPTGTVLDRTALARIVDLAERHDAYVVTDEVYEHLIFDGVRHTTLASVPGGSERGITISSAGKTFSVTGWKIGWIAAPAPVISAVQTVKQFLTFTTGAPFQPAIAAGLRLPDAVFDEVTSGLQRQRDLLHEALVASGFTARPAPATYFAVADTRPVGFAEATALARELPERVGVVGIPLTAFSAPEFEELYRPYLRFAFCKREAVLRDAGARLRQLHPRA